MAKGTQYSPTNSVLCSSLLKIGVVVTRALKGRKPVDESPLLLLIHIQTLAPSKNRWATPTHSDSIYILLLTSRWLLKMATDRFSRRPRLVIWEFDPIGCLFWVNSYYFLTSKMTGKPYLMSSFVIAETPTAAAQRSLADQNFSPTSKMLFVFSSTSTLQYDFLWRNYSHLMSALLLST